MKEKSSWQKTRKFFNDVHLWLGLISGIVIIAVCLSGTIYTYNTEIQEWAAPHLHKVEVPQNGSRIPAETVIANIKELTQANVTAIAISHDPARTYQVTVRKEGDNSRSGTSYYVNPYTGDITGTSLEKTATADFMRRMFSLHRWLLLDRIEEPLIGELPNRTLGSYITGAATILFTLGVITGMVIWVPQKVKSWKQGLKIKWDANWKRVNHDLHNTLAFYSLIILFVMGITGPQWSFPWYRTGLQKTLGTYKEAPARPQQGQGGSGEGSQRGGGSNREAREEKTEAKPVELLSIEQYMASADQTLPYKGNYRISLPQKADAPVEITKNRTGFFAPAAGDKLKLETATSEVLSAEIFRDRPFNERVAGSIKALHIGDVYGPFTKLLYFISCLIATSLPITGTIIWLNKLQKKKKRKKSPVKTPKYQTTTA
jgi:uncharacterized iron-regulated membrane protein